MIVLFYPKDPMPKPMFKLYDVMQLCVFIALIKKMSDEKTHFLGIM